MLVAAQTKKQNSQSSAATPADLELLSQKFQSPESFATFAQLFCEEAHKFSNTALAHSNLSEEAAQSFQLLQERKVGETKLRARRLAHATANSTGSAALANPNDLGTVFEITTEDMPFIVSSVVGEIKAQGFDVSAVFDALFKVQRGPDGALQKLSCRNEGDHIGSQNETFILLLLPPLSELERLQLEQGINLVLSDVRQVAMDRGIMLARLSSQIAAMQASPPASIPQEIIDETVAFSRWLTDGHFTFLGMRDYRLKGNSDQIKLSAKDKTGLGILRHDNTPILNAVGEGESMTPEVQRFFFAPQPIIINKANMVSRVNRRVTMDYIGFKTYSMDGRLTGVLRIVGLFNAEAYHDSARSIPFLRMKIQGILDSLHQTGSKHPAKSFINVLENFPRSELLQLDSQKLREWAQDICDLEHHPRLRVFQRIDRFDRFAVLLLYIPRDRYSTKIRKKIGDALARIYDGEIRSFHPYFIDGPLVRVRFVIAREDAPTEARNEREIEQELSTIIRTWKDSLHTHLVSSANTAGLIRKYKKAFPPSYTDVFSVERAAEDIRHIEKLVTDNPDTINFYQESCTPTHRIRAAIYCIDDAIPLSERVPLLENLGFKVIDERTYRLSPQGDQGLQQVCLHDMILETRNGQPADLSSHCSELEACFLAVRREQAEDDKFNALVLAANATWREAAMLRAYVGYMRQIRSPFGPRYVSQTLARHEQITQDLIDLFHIRFDPERYANLEERQSAETQISKQIDQHLSKVESLDEDRALRQLRNVMLATLRTNFYMTSADGKPLPAIAFKISSRDIDDAPEPRPYREVWVNSASVDGVHLRFASIARGGLRWSDRTLDFRTEVLGLAKAQQVKNTVIIPQGAKGGFVAKHISDGTTREERAQLGLDGYRLFVSTLLSLTDNLNDDDIVPPQNVVCHDDPDPYMVVAADKGTATFSDTANAISESQNYWLGDAFASGGSVGYDHKKMGITARGAWESVKRHFREMGKDIQKQPFSVAGCGDMSGDVFGNGMLLSTQIKLVAAFDHRDIFLDPNPDPKSSFEERERMFRLPRSSWQDYNKAKISTGGGVFSRNAKSIALSPEIKTLLGIKDNYLPPNDLIKLILKAQVDLLWFGGIGTYIRADDENNEAVGDRNNDVIRVQASDVKASVIGEGANLAITQHGRIAFSAHGGRINTDFIDNSAGVNSSDLEVNIKIALEPLTRKGALNPQGRADFLARMTDEVAQKCLENNYEQSLALSLAENEDHTGIEDHARLMRKLARTGILDRRLETLPDDTTIADRKTDGRGMTRPELAVLLSYVKLALSHEISQTQLPTDHGLQHLIEPYFPQMLVESYPQLVRDHRLKKEIITTVVTNLFVNRCGLTSAMRLSEDTGKPIDVLAKAFLCAREIFNLEPIWISIGALDNKISASKQIELYTIMQAISYDRTMWFAANNLEYDDMQEIISRHQSVVEKLRTSAKDIMTSTQLINHRKIAQSHFDAGLPKKLAKELAMQTFLANAPDIAEIAQGLPNNCISDIPEIAKAYFIVQEMLGITDLKTRAQSIPTTEAYSRTVIQRANTQITQASRTLAQHILLAEDRSAHATVEVRYETWRTRNEKGLSSLKARLEDLAGSETLSIPGLIVAATDIESAAELK